MSNIIKAEVIANRVRGTESACALAMPDRQSASPATGIVDAAAIISSARKRAAEILRHARLTAARMIAEDQERLSRLRAQSVEEGYQKGYSRGYEEGKRKAALEAEERLQERLSSLTRAAEELAALRRQAVAAAESDLVKFSVLIAEKIVRGELANPERTLQIARSLLSEVRDESHIVIFLPADLDLSSEDAGIIRREEFASGLKLRIEQDPALALGDVRVETRWGWIDGRASIRWARLIDALRKGSDDYDDAT